MNGNWKLEALALLTREVEQLREQWHAAEYEADEAKDREAKLRTAFNTADELLDKLREHVEQLAQDAKGGAK